jgi:organic radical activating enzyme
LAAAADSVNLLVVTGGEPLLQQKSLAGALKSLVQLAPHLRFEFETNGTVVPSDELAEMTELFVVSPKLSNAGMNRRERLRRDSLRLILEERSVLKFVVSSPSDLDEVDQIVDELAVDSSRVYLMPEGIDSETLVQRLPWVNVEATKRGYRVTTRLHVMLWGDARGR